MRPLGIVPDEPGKKLTIEGIGIDQQLLMMVDQPFPNRLFKPLHMGIHLGGFGRGMPVVFVQPPQFLVEILHELRAIVSEHRLKRIGEDLGDDAKEFGGGERSMALGGPGKAKPRVVIGKSDDVTSHLTKEVLQRVKGPTFTGSPGVLALGLSALGSLFPLDSLPLGSKLDGAASHPVRGIGN